MSNPMRIPDPTTCSAAYGEAYLALPGRHLTGVVLPRNWERAYGYRGDRRFVAAWWRPNGGEVAEAMVSDGDHGALAAGWPFFFDLIKLLIRNGYGWERLTCYAGDHCLVLDLKQRTVRHAPLDGALVWLRERAASGADELPGGVKAEDIDACQDRVRGGRLCVDCGGYGWRRAGDWSVVGYRMCRVCGGEGWLPARKGEDRDAAAVDV